MSVLCELTANARQKNEGAFQYTLNDSADGSAVVLEVAVGRYMDTAEIQVDVQPLLVRCLVRGRLLQVHTPEVRTDLVIHPCAASHVRRLCAGGASGRQLVPALDCDGLACGHHAQGWSGCRRERSAAAAEAARRRSDVAACYGLRWIRTDTRGVRCAARGADCGARGRRLGRTAAIALMI
jgi:protein TilB